MWIKARALAALSGRLPGSVTVDIGFQKPLYLPSTVTVATAPVAAAGTSSSATRRAAREHLVGTVRPL